MDIENLIGEIIDDIKYYSEPLDKEKVISWLIDCKNRIEELPDETIEAYECDNCTDLEEERDQLQDEVSELESKVEELEQEIDTMNLENPTPPRNNKDDNNLRLV